MRIVYFRLVVHTDAIIDTRAQKIVSHTVAYSRIVLFYMTNIERSITL